MGLDEKYHIFKLGKFGIASVAGFLMAELLLTLGVLLLFGKLSPPSDAYSSPTFLALDVAVLAFGVFVAFLINERFTVKVELVRDNEASKSRAGRLLKFEGVNAVGNAAVIGVQFALFAALSIAPAIGNVAGSIVASPITYLISMRVVWNPAADVPMDKSLINHRNQPPRKGSPFPPPVAAIVSLVSLYAFGQLLRRRRRHPSSAATSVHGRFPLNGRSNMVREIGTRISFRRQFAPESRNRRLLRVGRNAQKQQVVAKRPTNPVFANDSSLKNALSIQVGNHRADRD
jgi:putative flippase GtrA